MGVVVGLLVIGATLVCSWRMPESRAVLREWRLLLPFLIVRLAGLAAAFVASSIGASRQAVGLWSATAVLLLVCVVFEAAWVSPLLMEAARGRRVAGRLLSSLHAVPSHLLRTSAVLALGFSPVLVALSISASFGNRGVVVLLVGTFGLLACLLWSVLSGSLVFEALDRDRPLSQSIGRGFRLAILNFPDWFLLFLSLAVLRGAIVVLPNSTSLHLLWLGGYGSGSHWFEEAAANAPHAANELLDSLVMVTTLFLDVTIKLRIASRVVRRDQSFASPQH